MTICKECNNTGFIKTNYFDCFDHYYSYTDTYTDTYTDNSYYSGKIKQRLPKLQLKKCNNCIICDYCHNTILSNTSFFVKYFYCRKCNVDYSISGIITMYKTKNYNDKVICYLDNSSLIYWKVNNNYVEIKCNDAPKHPHQLIDFVNKHLKFLILK